MAVPNRGFGSFYGFGIESTWGTAVARTNWMPAISVGGLKRTLDIRKKPHLGINGATSTNQRSHYLSSDKSGGSIEVAAAYDDSTVLLLAHALGAVVESGAGPYVHTLTAAAPGTLSPLTIEQGLGTGDSEVYEGCIPSGFELKFAANDIARLVINGIIGQTSGGLVSQGTPTQPASSPIIGNHAGVFNFNSINWDITELMISGNRNYGDRMVLGDVNTKEPTPNGFMELSAKVTVEYGQASGLDAAWKAITQGDATITFTGSGNDALAIIMQNAYITDIQRSIGDAGIIRQTVDFSLESDGTDEGLSLAFTNDNTLYSTNSA